MIELIMSITVLSILVGTATIILGSILNTSTQSQIFNVSVDLAEQELERVTGLRFSQVTNEGPVSYSNPFSYYSYEIQVSPVPTAWADDPNMLNYKQVKVIVQYSPTGKNVDLSTIVVNKV